MSAEWITITHFWTSRNSVQQNCTTDHKNQYGLHIWNQRADRNVSIPNQDRKLVETEMSRCAFIVCNSFSLFCGQILYLPGAVLLFYSNDFHTSSHANSVIFCLSSDFNISGFLSLKNKNRFDEFASFQLEVFRILICWKNFFLFSSKQCSFTQHVTIYINSGEPIMPENSSVMNATVNCLFLSAIIDK